MSDMQEVVNKIGWAKDWPELARATMALASHVDTRLLALEDSKNTPETRRLEATIRELTRQRSALAAQLDDLRNVNAGLRADNDTLRKDNDANRADYVNRESTLKNLREGNAELRKHYTNKNDLCAALQKQNVTLWDDNAGLRKDNERQSELIAALRQNSADLVESMKYLLSEAEPNKERMAVLESLQDENATLRSRLAATSHQTDEIKRLEAVCDDLSDKLDAANCR